MKYITAKHIVKLFKTTGRIETKCSNKPANKKDTLTQASTSEAASPTLKHGQASSFVESNYTHTDASMQKLQCMHAPNH